MAASIPFLSAYDPSGTSEGTLDPLGLYQIADQLAVQLVPGVRERMQRIRFLSAMAVGALVTEGLEDDPKVRDASPYLVWEWLIVEALMRARGDDPGIWGVPGTLVTRRALGQHGYLDARSYLKTPRIFGFHGVYKTLAVRLGLMNVHLGPAANTEALADAWSRSVGFSGLNDAKTLLLSWRRELERCLKEKPPRCRPNWTLRDWSNLAEMFALDRCRGHERRYLRALLLSNKDHNLGFLPVLWQIISENGADLSEESLHNVLEKREPSCASLLNAIRSYEAFARSLQDAFDVLRADAATLDARGFKITDIAKEPDFLASVNELQRRFELAHDALGEVMATSVSPQAIFANRFAVFAEPLDPARCALVLCTHHENVQRGKSAAGKRPWFDRLAPDRIYIRHAYRLSKLEIQLSRYLHDYRCVPIRRFLNDLT